jgi:hypothetical protein
MTGKVDIGRIFMRQLIVGLTGAAALLAAASVANAQGTVKIGLIMPYSGQFADTATQMDNAIKLYVKQHSDTVAGKKIEFIQGHGRHRARCRQVPGAGTDHARQSGHHRAGLFSPPTAREADASATGQR